VSQRGPLAHVSQRGPLAHEGVLGSRTSREGEIVCVREREIKDAELLRQQVTAKHHSFITPAFYSANVAKVRLKGVLE